MSTTSQTLNTLNLLQKKVVTVDVECTTSNKGNAFDLTNKLVTIQLKVNNDEPMVLFQEDFDKALSILQEASCVVGFNLKFDLSWLRRELNYIPTCVWDCQLAEFMFSNQTWLYPDLNTTCDKYGVGHKLDEVANYWARGVDTDTIPRDVLSEYGAQDVNLTYEVFLRQVARFSDDDASLFRLFRLHCNDQIVLADMEFNGICYDTNASLAKAENLDAQIAETERKLSEFANNVPINWSSGDHKSCFLYGGTIKEDVRLPIGVYKSGKKIGETRYKLVEKEYQLPRLVEPVKNSELKKEGYYSTDETTLLTVKTNKTTKKLIEWLLERAKIAKLKSTYLLGLPKTIEKFNWRPNMLYSTLNQCVAVTGRLSSSKPNQQNFPKEAKQFCITRY